MKKLLLLFIFFTVLALSARAATDTAATPATNVQSVLGQVTATAKQTVTTNINQVMVEILSGVKDASGEMYHFSKQEIGQGYDYLKSQAPDTIKEFLLWQATKNIFYIVLWCSIAAVIFFFARKFRLYGQKEEDTDALVFMWILRIVACVMIFGAVASYGLNVAKVAVAPRVFIIQYVIDVCQGHGAEYK